MSASYQCPTCKRRYVSPLKLVDKPRCTGKSRKHSEKVMQPIKQKEKA